MPDNKLLPPTGSGTADIRVATRTVTYSGDVADVQAVALTTFAGADDAKTVADVPLPAALGAGGGLKVDGSGTAIPISQPGLPTALGAAASAASLTVVQATDGTVLGPVTEAAPASDTASSGLNGRLQRIAQRLTSIIALLPTALGSGGGLKVEGDVASGVADAGSPVKVGGIVNATSPVFVDGQRADLQLTARGLLKVVFATSDSAGLVAVFSPSYDAAGTSGNYLGVGSFGYVFNGATFDRLRNNSDLTLLASAARTTTTASPDQTNFNSRGLQVVLDVTLPGTGSITLTIQGKDSVSGQYYTILAGVAVTTTSTTVYRVYPGLLAAVNAIANDILPRTWRVNVVANNANSVVYSVGASVIL